MSQITDLLLNEKTPLVSQADLKYKLQEYISEADRFRCLDEEFLPIELEHMKDSYQYIINQLGKICHQTSKYHRACDRYKRQVQSDLRTIGRLDIEIAEMEHSAEIEKEEAMRSAEEFKTRAQFLFNEVIEKQQPVRDLVMIFEAYYSLAFPRSYDGDFNWTYVIAMLKDREGLFKSMKDSFDKRVGEISRAEIEKVQEMLRKFKKEFGMHDKTHQGHILARAMHNYLESFIDVYDFRSSAMARRDLKIVKLEKVEFLRKELATYRLIRDDLERQTHELVEKYQKSKEEYENLKDEEVKGEKALQNFDEHLKELERKNKEGKLDVIEAEQDIDRLKEDTMEMNRITIKVAYTVPPDTSFA